MDKKFIKNIITILQDYLSTEHILASSSQKTIKDLERIMIKQLLDESISIEKREDILANFISRYLNNTKIFNYDLKIFNKFHNDVNTIFSEKDYWIMEQEIPYNSGYIHTVLTPSHNSHMKKVDDHLKEVDAFHIEEIEATLEDSNKYRKIVSQKNQHLITELINNYNTYLKLIKNHFDGVEIDLANEKEFVSTIQKIRSLVESLHLGFIVDRYDLKKIIPFTSLFSLEQDWDFEVKDQRKKILLEEKEKIKYLEFNLDNIKSRVMKEISRINKYIDYSTIENISSESKDNIFEIKVFENNNKYYFEVNNHDPILVTKGEYKFISHFKNSLSEVSRKDLGLEGKKYNNSLTSFMSRLNGKLEDINYKIKNTGPRGHPIYKIIKI